MTNQTQYIVANWKMHGSRALAQELCPLVQATAGNVQVVICPPATLIAQVAAQFQQAGAIGAQDCHAEPEGAFTGDISAPMLKEAGANYVILGHSERRQGHGETSVQVSAKAAAALSAGLIPIICIGETGQERADGLAEAVVAGQLRDSLPKTYANSKILLAYEPVWAIGSGQTPTLDNIVRMHRFIRSQLPGARTQVPLLYGGSVKASNSADILGLEDVDGVLVGGASLKAEEFKGILDSAVR